MLSALPHPCKGQVPVPWVSKTSRLSLNWHALCIAPPLQVSEGKLNHKYQVYSIPPLLPTSVKSVSWQSRTSASSSTYSILLPLPPPPSVNCKCQGENKIHQYHYQVCSTVPQPHGCQVPMSRESQTSKISLTDMLLALPHSGKCQKSVSKASKKKSPLSLNWCALHTAPPHTSIKS